MLYNRLLYLYKKHRNNNKTPLEDFTTELLVGILEDDQKLLDKFVNNILKIDGDGFEIDSQEKYKLHKDTDCIIDVVIKNDNTICFLENKVNSYEGDRQLERYSKVLKKINEKQNKNIYLRYCTKYYDPKKINHIDFLQYRWCDVYRFFEQYIDNNLIMEYLDFLEEEGMSSAGDFNYEDLIVMTKINSTIAKMDECLDNIKETLSSIFNEPNERDYKRLKQIMKEENYIIWVEDIISNSRSYMSVGFTFQEDLDTKAPFLNVDLSIHETNLKFNKVVKMKDELESIFDSDYSDDEKLLFSFEKSLSDFISNDNQFEDICDWFNNNIYTVKTLIDKIEK